MCVIFYLSLFVLGLDCFSLLYHLLTTLALTLGEYAKESKSSKSTPEKWLMRGTGFEMLENTRAFLNAAGSLLAILSDVRNSRLMISEDILERLICAPIVSLPLGSRTNSEKNKIKVSTSQKSTKKSKKVNPPEDDNDEDDDNVGHDHEDYDGIDEGQLSHTNDKTSKAILGTVNRVVLPILTNHLSLLENVIVKFKQSDKICIILYELCTRLLKLDASINSQLAEQFDPTGGALLVPLQKEAISLLRALFRNYSLHRAPIIQELLTGLLFISLLFSYISLFQFTCYLSLFNSSRFYSAITNILYKTHCKDLLFGQ